MRQLRVTCHRGELPPLPIPLWLGWVVSCLVGGGSGWLWVDHHRQQPLKLLIVSATRSIAICVWSGATSHTSASLANHSPALTLSPAHITDLNHCRPITAANGPHGGRYRLSLGRDHQSNHPIKAQWYSSARIKQRSLVEAYFPSRIKS